ncbi:MAG: hypothetical protein GY768_24255 [Planctomycetaceae bacterium]|nr:hypothetical protein [Planctomycetaceae bacterium]
MDTWEHTLRLLLGTCDLQGYLTFEEVQNTLCTFRAAAVTFDFFLRRFLVRVVQQTAPELTLRKILERLIRRAEAIQHDRILAARVRSSRNARVLEMLLATTDLQGHLNLREVRSTLSICRRTALSLVLFVRWLIPRLVWRAIIRRRVEFAAALWDVSDTDTVVDVDDFSVASSDASYDHTPTIVTWSEDSVTLEISPDD